MAKKTVPTKPKTIGYLQVSTGAQDLDKNKAAILRLANQEDLGRVQFVEEKVSGKVSWRKRRIADWVERERRLLDGKKGRCSHTCTLSNP
jgi:hypothetical protein